jgi:uncharacterized coiled-coil DUF342 family protein
VWGYLRPWHPFCIEQVVHNSPEHGGQRQEDDMNEREAYMDKMHAQIDKVDARIKELSAKARNAKADASIEMKHKVDELRSKRKEIDKKMSSLRDASSDSWGDVKNGFERAWRELKSSVESAATRFQ